MVKQTKKPNGKKNPYVSIPFANKMYEAYLDRDKAERVKKRNFINDAISSIITNIIILCLGYNFGKEDIMYAQVFFGAGILCCIASMIFAVYKIRKGESKKQNIVKIVIHSIFLLVFIIETVYGTMLL